MDESLYIPLFSLLSMDVIIVHPKVPIYGGAEVVITKLVNGLKKKGVNAKLLTSAIPQGMERDLRPESLVLVKKRNNPFPVVWSIDPTELYAIHRWLKTHKHEFDVVNLHNYPIQFAVIGIKKPIVWTCNEPVLHLFYESGEIKKNKFVMQSLMIAEKFVVRAFVDAAVVADEYNYERFVKIYGFRPVIVPYGIDYDFFSGGDKKFAMDKFGIKEEDFTILQVGMFCPFKNQKKSVEIVKNLVNSIPNLKLYLVGHMDNTYYPEVEKMAENFGLMKKIVFINHITRDELRSLYKACNVLVHPVKPQGGWLAPFEALCAETPVVVSQEFTAKDIIKQEGIGVVTEEYEKTIFDIHRHPEKYRNMAKKGAEFVRKNLNWDNYCERMIEVYLQAMEVKK